MSVTSEATTLWLGDLTSGSGTTSLDSSDGGVFPVTWAARSGGGGDTVTIDASNASADDAVFTCVPGIIINDPDGVRIQFLELYSAQGSENRPVVDGELIVKMDAGPVNAFK